ncbi:hypothetical protein ABBQ38_15530 [Trebouxia sp. C0009 RCD-2024]
MSDVSCGMFAMRADPEGPGMVHAAIPQDAAFVCYYRAVGIEHFYKDHHKKASAPGCIQSEPAALPVRFLSDSDDDVAGEQNLNAPRKCPVLARKPVQRYKKSINVSAVPVQVAFLSDSG